MVLGRDNKYSSEKRSTEEAAEEEEVVLVLPYSIGSESKSTGLLFLTGFAGLIGLIGFAVAAAVGAAVTEEWEGAIIRLGEGGG